MDAKEEARLLRLFDEVEAEDSTESENYSSSSRDDGETDEDAYAGSDDNDVDYVPSDDDSESNEPDSDLEHSSPESDCDTTVVPSSSEPNFSLLSAEEWVDNVDDIPDFEFDSTNSGVKLVFDHVPSPLEVFRSLWDDDVLSLLTSCTNEYGKKMELTNRPHAKHARMASFPNTNFEEVNKFLGLSLLQAQIRFPTLRKMFSYDPLYYHPIFSNVMSGRRYEQLLRALNCTDERQSEDRLNKVSSLLQILIRNFQKAYSPGEALSLDESLLLHRGRLSFRQYIKNKRAKYGIKFFELCSPNGYNLNIEIYKGKQSNNSEISKLQSLVLRLMDSFLDKGHHVIMDNYYNSVELSNKLLLRNTHSTGTLRTNRKENPKQIISKKLNKGEHIWKRKGKVYVSKWKDKREVLCITTKFHPTMVEVANSYGKISKKPMEVHEYNLNMSGVDRGDQPTSYYSCPRKSVRWYKKVIFHMLDVSVVNSFILFREMTKSKISLLRFRELLIRGLVGTSADLKDGRRLVKRGPSNIPAKRIHITADTADTIRPQHVLEKIPVPENSKRKSNFLRCRECSRNGKRGQTSWRCKMCETHPPLCVGQCFENFHFNLP